MKYPFPFEGTSSYPNIPVRHLYEMQYFLARLLHITPAESDNLTYIEVDIYLNMYKKEIQDKIEAREDKKNNMVDLKSML